MSREKINMRLLSSPVGFTLILMLIALAGGVLRLPGLSWEKGLVVQQVGYTLHPDESTFVTQIQAFDEKSPTGKGYVKGWSTHGYVLSKLASRFLNVRDIQIHLLMRYLSLLYALLTIVLVGWAGRILWNDPKMGVWGAVFLAVSALHIVHSHFGVADSAATFYCLLAIVFAVLYAKKKSEWLFLLLSFVVGVAIAVKFQLSLLPLVFWVCWVDQKRWLRVAQSCLLVIAGFQIASFFNYTPWEMKDFYHMLVYKNIRISTLPSHSVDVVLLWKLLIPALGFGAVVFMFLGAGHLVVRGFNDGWRRFFRRCLESPWIWFLIPAVFQYAMFSYMDVKGARHILILVPAACLVAARGVVVLEQRLQRTRTVSWLFAPLMVSVLVYQVVYVGNVETLFSRDPRFQASRWLSERVLPQETVTAYSTYTRVPGRYSIVDYPSDYVLAASPMYRHYPESTHPTIGYHWGGGKQQQVFWNQLFRGELDYVRERVFYLDRVPLELRLGRRIGIENNMGAFIADKVVIFRKKHANHSVFSTELNGT